jgi:hypothetical protein
MDRAKVFGYLFFGKVKFRWFLKIKKKSGEILKD